MSSAGCSPHVDFEKKALFVKNILQYDHEDTLKSTEHTDW